VVAWHFIVDSGVECGSEINVSHSAWSDPLTTRGSHRGWRVWLCKACNVASMQFLTPSESFQCWFLRGARQNQNWLRSAPRTIVRHIMNHVSS